RNITSASIIWQEGDAFPADLNWEEQEMLIGTEEAYNLFYRTFGRLGYDDENGQMRQVVRATLSNCPNASSRRNAIYNCEGVVSDDIVAHEWTHNYIAEMNGLIYLFESGAINEAYADIFGEVVDLINSRGNDLGEETPRVGCFDSGLRWKLGEDATAVDSIIRDLWLPECRHDPSNRSSDAYACLDESEDNGGVHINNGLVNRTFSLLVDGGMLNGEFVEGIGLTKALHVFFHAADKYITPATDFNALGVILKQSLQDLRGIDLPALTVLNLPVRASGDTLNAVDSLQLEAAIRATELLEPSPCGFIPTLAQNPPENCATADIPSFVPLLSEDWEAGIPTDWEITEHPVHPNTWDAKPWEITNVLPDGRPGKGVLAPNGDFGDCRSDLDNGFVTLTSPPVVFPPEESDFQLSFDHYYAIEEAYDGGILFYSLNGADFEPVPESAFLFNGYDGPLEPLSVNDNPMAGLPAFQGGDQNSTTGSWGTSQVDISALGVQGGDELQLRWVFSQDGCGGWLGWFLDDVSVGFCGTSILPVTYASFTAEGKKDHIALEWETETENENEGFTVERANSVTSAFEPLGFVAAVSSGFTYTFDDYSPTPGLEYYYRLRQTDFDGSYEFSPIVSASLKEDIEGLWVYPNPATHQFTVVAPNSTSRLRLTDARGRLVLEKDLSSAGTTTLPTTSLSPGIYFLSVGAMAERIVIR
ncbi:MAG: M4 family metallopeptidase, partial [Bacteroidota bacterium]